MHCALCNFAVTGVCTTCIVHCVISLLQVYAQEDQSADKQISNVSEVIITVLDVNDNTPAFVGNPYAFQVNETEAEGHVVGQVGFSTHPGFLVR